MKLNNRTLLQQMSLVISPLALLALAPAAYSADSFTDAVTGGKVSANLQYRYENVNQDNALRTAHASTARLRLGYETAEFMGFGAMVQIEHITGNSAYNSTTNGKTQYSVVADPEGTEINQAYISYSGVPQTKLKLGRQVITYDNHRWVGNVVWRQNWQTYDGYTAVNQSLPNTTISAAYVTNVNRVFSDANPTQGNHHMQSPLINVKYSGLGFADVVGYGYFLDYDSSAAAFGLNNSTQTVGLRLTGHAPMAGNNLLYTAEYATQSDYKSNPNNYRVHYSLLEGGADIKVATFKVGYEVLSSNGRQSLSTPLATLFAHNGWADQFLVTPTKGLQDVYVSARTNLAGMVSGVVLGADYHDFRADSGSQKYATEIDLIAEKAIDKTYSVGTRAAFFNAKSSYTAAVDVNKFWLYGSMNF
ncbi:MAG: alginate export family protein [Candidatus Nitrotoga sp.]